MSQFIFAFSQFQTNSWNFFLFTCLYGISLSMVEITLFSIPMIIIRNLKDDYFAYPYATYTSLMYFCFMISNFFRSIIFDVFIGQLLLYISSTVVCFYVFMMMIGWYRCIYMSKESYKQNYEIKTNESNLSPGRGNSMDFVMKNEEKSSGCSKKWLIIFYFPLELIIFFVAFLLLLGMTGIGNLIFYYYFERQSLDNVKYTRVYFLPFLSLIFSISLFFSFPDSTRK